MHYKDKIEKLKNPNHSVSDKRVVLKHLDKDITETQIRDLAFQFLKYYQLPRKELTYVVVEIFSVSLCSTPTGKKVQGSLSCNLLSIKMR